MFFCSLAVYIIGCFVLYKIVDYLIRFPRVANDPNRYILVTGCDTGFGNLIAKRLDQLGCHVFAGCLTEKGETELKKSCSERLHAISLDVTSRESVRNALEYVTAKLPQGKGLWGILNNAGNFLAMGSPDWCTVDDYKKQCDVNLWGLIDVTLTFLSLVKKERGRVVNTASLAGRTSVTEALPYSVSKYGVEAFTDGIRRTIHYFGCKASLIEPGGFRTQIVDSLRVGCAALWQKASPEVKDEYGDHFFKYMLETYVGESQQYMSSVLSLVVDAYEHALLGRYPRARYLIGNDARFILAPIQTLPEWLGDWILRKLQPGRPLPAAVKRQ